MRRHGKMACGDLSCAFFWKGDDAVCSVPAMAGRKRDLRLIEHTMSLCSECMRRVDADVAEEAGSIYLVKRCPVHGEQIVLREKSADFYLHRARFDKPGTDSRRQTSVARGCPFDCGLCPEHRQHTCIGLIEITGNCDLECPSCYSAPNRGWMLGMGQVERMVDFFQESENGRAEILQISGGEPCTHPEIIEILRMAMSKGFTYVMLNTNGVRIARDPTFAAELGALGRGFEVYLQFDGMTPEASVKLRGRDLTAVRKAAVANLCRNEVQMTLVATIGRGINEGEVGQILEYGMEAGTARGVNFQPLTSFRGGRCLAAITLTELLEKVEEQSHGVLRMGDFVPLPCDVERVALTYLYRDGDRFVPAIRGVDMTRYLNLLGNTFTFDVDDFLEKADCGCGAGCGLARSLVQLLSPMIPAEYRTKTLEEKVKHFNDNVFRVSVSSFVDPETFDLKSMQKECVHVITPDLKRVPFSAYNMVHRK